MECFDGYYGTRCDEKCPVECKRCVGTYSGSSSAYCIECLPGHYGHHCMFNCSYCAEGLCSRDNCVNGCIEGWREYQSRMCVKCPNTCETCNPWSWNDEKCTSCPHGAWGNLCDRTCPDSCPGQTCNQDTGQCECVSGFYLDKENNVCEKCPENCLECRSPTSCMKCKESKYGDVCEKSCIPNCLECPPERIWNPDTHMYNRCHYKKCKKGYYLKEYCEPCDEGCSACWWRSYSRIQDCTACHEGYYRAKMKGSYVTKCFKCPPGCKVCTPYGECYSCFEGYHQYEYTCCPNNCTTCSSPTSCTACIDGLYGSTCNMTCPGNCQTCRDGKLCDSCKTGTYSFSKYPSKNFCECSTFECIYYKPDGNCSACKQQGWYPRMAECCECRNCKDSMCDGNGNCYNGCALSGTFGAKCDLKCQDSHSNYMCVNCTGQDIMSMKCTACASRYYYVAAGQCVRCSQGCRDHTCGEGGACHGCKEGLFGDQCSFDCPRYCKQCEQSGCRLCQDGYFGEECHQQCSPNCLGAICDKNNGRCTQGCVDGFRGDRCGIRRVGTVSDTGRLLFVTLK